MLSTLRVSVLSQGSVSEEPNDRKNATQVALNPDYLRDIYRILNLILTMSLTISRQQLQVPLHKKYGKILEASVVVSTAFRQWRSQGQDFGEPVQTSQEGVGCVFSDANLNVSQVQLLLFKLDTSTTLFIKLINNCI